MSGKAARAERVPVLVAPMCDDMRLKAENGVMFLPSQRSVDELFGVLSQYGARDGVVVVPFPSCGSVAVSAAIDGRSSLSFEVEPSVFAASLKHLRVYVSSQSRMKAKEAVTSQHGDLLQYLGGTQA